MLSALEPNGPSWRPLASPTWLHRFCANAAYDACNWLVPIHSPEMYCRACRHNRVIPDLTGPGNILAWQKLEAAKHRLLYTLLKLNLPLPSCARQRQTPRVKSRSSAIRTGLGRATEPLFRPCLTGGMCWRSAKAWARTSAAHLLSDRLPLKAASSLANRFDADRSGRSRQQST